MVISFQKSQVSWDMFLVSGAYFEIPWTFVLSCGDEIEVSIYNWVLAIFSGSPQDTSWHFICYRGSWTTVPYKYSDKVLSIKEHTILSSLFINICFHGMKMIYFLKKLKKSLFFVFCCHTDSLWPSLRHSFIFMCSALKWV